MNSFFERQFRLQEHHSSVSTEILAGLTTFATMGYVLAVVPHMMGEAGVPTGDSLQRQQNEYISLIANDLNT